MVLRLSRGLDCSRPRSFGWPQMTATDPSSGMRVARRTAAAWVAEVLRLTDACGSLIGPCDVGMRVRRVAFECGMVLLVAVRTAVRRWQPGALRDDQGGSPLDLPGTDNGSD